MASDPNAAPSPTDEFEVVDDTLEDVLYSRHAEIKSFEDLEKQRGTSIPALFNQLYKFVQNPSSISVETYKRMVDTDDTIGGGVDFLTTCLAARIGRYVHESPEITEFINKALDEMEGGWHAAIKEIMSATWAGFSVHEKVWANKANGFVIQKLVPLPPMTVLFETERTGELTPDGILQYQRNYNPYIGGGGFGYLTGAASLGTGFNGFGSSRPDPFAKFGDFPFPLRTANSFNYLSIRIPRQKCIHFPFNAQGQFGNPYGKSLLRRIYKYYTVKDAVLQMMIIALDRKGTPLTIVYADPNTMLEDPTVDGGTLDSEKYRQNPKGGMRADMAARDAFKNVHNDSTIILPGKKDSIFSTDKIENSSNASDFIAALDFCNKSMLRGLLLPALIFGNGDGTGSFALGQEHAKTFDKICDSVNAAFEHVALQQIVKELIAYNFPRSAWEKDGLGSFSKKTLSREEIAKEMEVFEKGITAGLIDANDLNDLNQMRETINFQPRDKIIEKMPIFGMGTEITNGNPDIPPPPGQEPAPGAPPAKPEEKAAKETQFARLVAYLRGALGLA